MMREMRIFLLFTAVILFRGETALPASADYCDQYNVTWNSQSQNSSESMPLGGGDVGLNVWVENNELLFYLSQSGAFDENNSFLKLGRIRLRTTPNLFEPGGRFCQQLNLRDGSVAITGCRDGKTVEILLWVDVFRPVVHIDINSDTPLLTEAQYETWRTEDRPVPPEYRSVCFSYTG